MRVIVTGAGRGIGEAIAHAFAARGDNVIVNDLDPATCDESAARIGAVSIPGDAATSSGIERLIESARAEVGGIDVFVANAGIEGGAGLDTPDEAWARALDVNVMAHVRAARLLVPDWLERGQGRFITVASAAGLLTMIGSAPYSVTKHAAVAFAEWLSATYRHRGIVVQAVCPQGVRTPMYEGAGPLKPMLAHDGLLEPQDVAASLMTALEDDRFLVLPHDTVAGYYQARANDPDAWLAQMNGIQQWLERPDSR
jgi:NAD(P)-dependent dehydrogenase (short-subunit alcohol dehydrogenase family)